MRLITATLLLALSGSAALAQIPAGPGQQPGTLPPAYVPPPPPPPPVAPAPVPSAVTPLPSPRYGVPPGVTAPVTYGRTGTAPVYRQKPPKKRPKPKKRPRTSEAAFIQTV